MPYRYVRGAPLLSDHGACVASAPHLPSHTPGELPRLSPFNRNLANTATRTTHMQGRCLHALLVLRRFAFLQPESHQGSLTVSQRFHRNLATPLNAQLTYKVDACMHCVSCVVFARVPAWLR